MESAEEDSPPFLTLLWFCASWKMGTKVTKPGNNDLVTKLSPNKENSGNSASQHETEKAFQRPPSGMPNPRDEAPKMTFLSVPSAVYIDDDSISSLSADTTVMTKSSTSSSTANLALSGESRRYSLSTFNRGSSEESTKASLPNLTTSGIQINSSGASASRAYYSREENMNILHDIEESPTPSALEISAENSPVDASARPKILIPPKIEFDAENICTEDKSVTEKRQIKVKTPKSYFLESLQKRKKCAKDVLSAVSVVTPNAFRRSQKMALESAETMDDEKDFTDLEALQVHPESPEKDQNIKGSGGGEKAGKKFWSAPLKAHKYVVEYPPKTLQWSSNMQQKYRRN